MINRLARGVLRGVLSVRRLTLPVLNFLKPGKTLPTLPVDRKFPAAGLMRDPNGANAGLEPSDVEHTITHACERLAEPNSPRGITTGPEGQRWFASKRQLVEDAGPDVRRAGPVPPLSDEHTPDRALAVGGFQHLVDIAEEPRHAADVEYA